MNNKRGLSLSKIKKEHQTLKLLKPAGRGRGRKPGSVLGRPRLIQTVEPPTKLIKTLGKMKLKTVVCAT